MQRRGEGRRGEERGMGRNSNILMKKSKVEPEILLLRMCFHVKCLLYQARKPINGRILLVPC
jgi:hypothetical protein